MHLNTVMQSRFHLKLVDTISELPPKRECKCQTAHYRQCHQKCGGLSFHIQDAAS